MCRRELRVLGSVLSLLLLAQSIVSAADSGPAKLIEQGHFKRAKVALSASLQQNPNDPRAHYLMSKVYVAFLQGDDAIKQAEQAVATDANNADFHTQLAESIAAKLISKDTGFFEAFPLVSRFKEQTDLALKLDPKNPRTNSDLVRFYLQAPALLGGSRSKAKTIAEQLTQWAPMDGYLAAAKVAVAEGAKEEEIGELLRKASEAGPGNYDAQMALAEFYVTAKKSALAEEYARKAEKIDPQRVAAYTTLAGLYTDQKNWEALDSLLTEAEHNVPDNFAPFYRAAKTILLGDYKGQFSLAESFLRKYLTQEPEALEPPWSAAHWRLGQLLAKEGKKEEAKKELRAALQVEPSLKEAQQDLKQLE